MIEQLTDLKISVVGLGYVGLPLALAFGRKYNTVGYDVNQKRVASLAQGVDVTKECLPADFAAAEYCSFSTDNQDLADCNVYVIAVPTPLDKNKRPDLHPLKSASREVGEHLGKGNVVIFESTVFPGATEEVCVPILEKASGLKFNKDFLVCFFIV